MILFILGLTVGAFIGMVAMAMLVVSKQADEAMPSPPPVRQVYGPVTLTSAMSAAVAEVGDEPQEGAYGSFTEYADAMEAWLLGNLRASFDEPGT